MDNKSNVMLPLIAPIRIYYLIYKSQQMYVP